MKIYNTALKCEQKNYNRVKKKVLKNDRRVKKACEKVTSVS